MGVTFMLKVMMSVVSINLRMLDPFMKDRVMSNLKSTLVVTIHHTIEKIP